MREPDRFGVAFACRCIMASTIYRVRVTPLAVLLTVGIFFLFLFFDFIIARRYSHFLLILSIG